MIEQTLIDLVGTENVDLGASIRADDSHDEALGERSVLPRVVVRPSSTEEVAAIVRAASAAGIPITARGSGTGLSGGCIPCEGGIVVSFERMDRIVEIDLANHVAVVEPGVTLEELEAALAETGLIYPVFPGEQSASLGGNVATNAGGMRAVKYGVTRHHVLGVEAVLGTGEVISTGGKYVKSTSGYDLTQLIIGSEGTLALVTRVTLRLHPRATEHATLLAPFSSIDELARAVPAIVGSGVDPVVVEYVDLLTMAAITDREGLELGIPEPVRHQALAYLVVVLEARRRDRLDEDVEELAGIVTGLGALEVYVLPSQAGTQLIQARERAFWSAKAAGADDLVDVVVPRASIPRYLDAVAEVAGSTGSLITGCGHAGDGNVHLSVFQPDAGLRDEVMRRVLAAGLELGGAISGEHGIGLEKRPYLAELENPAKLALMRRIKRAFDPSSILNPGTIFDVDDAEEGSL
jgi:glycolate oxidase